MALGFLNQGKAKEFAPVIGILEDDLRAAEYEAVNEGHHGPEKAIQPRMSNEYVAQSGNRTDNCARPGTSSGNAAVQNALDREVMREVRPFQTIEPDQAP
jgi:hypothetical protein